MTRQLRILALIFDPHPSQRTRTAVNALLAGAQTAGAHTQIHESADGSIHRELLAEADGLVLASPTYRATASWPLKRFLDEVERSATDRPESALRTKAIQVLLTGASSHHFLGTQPIVGILSDFFGGQVLSPSLHLAHNDFTPEKELVDAAAARVASHGSALTALARLCQSGAFSELYPLV